MFPRLASSARDRWQDLVSVLFPSPCLVCGGFPGERIEGGVCLPCWARVEYVTGPACPTCGRPHPDLEDDDLEGLPCGACVARKPPFDAGLSLGLYRGTLRSLIRLLKFSDRPELAGPLAERAYACWRRRRSSLPEVDLLVPVPLPLLRRVRRGYNQSAEVGRRLARLAGLPTASRALARRIGGRLQAGLPASRRAGNVRGAFRPRRAARLAGRSILLLDDVWTTGATLRECARALRRGGARRVVAFSLARVPADFDSAFPRGL